MKKLHFLLVIFSLLCSDVQTQTTSIFAGAGFIPNKGQRPENCYSFWSPYLECNTLDWRRSYQFYAGFEKNVRLLEHWSLLGAWQVQHQVNPTIETYRRYDPKVPGELLFESKSNSRYRITTLQISLSLEREFEIRNRSVQVFAGGYARFLLEDWKKVKGKGTEYVDVVEGVFFDSLCQCYKDGIVSKSKLEPPVTYDFEYEHNPSDTRHINLGIQAGLTFPLLSSKEGLLKGRLAVAGNLKPFFQNDLIPDLHHISLMAGLVFEPENFSRPNPRKPEKRTLASGIYGGGSLHLNFLSVDGVWLSSKNLGIDLAARYSPISVDRIPKAQVYGGPVYRLGNSRFFARAGVAYSWILDSEYYDETRLSFVLGGKYVWPFCKILGLQVNGGWVIVEGGEPGIDLGFGLLFLPR